MHRRIAFVAAVVLLGASTAARAQPRDWIPSSGDVAQALAEQASPALPATLALLANAAVMWLNIYGLATRRRLETKVLGVALGYALGAIELAAGLAVTARHVDDPAIQREDRVVGPLMLALAAANVGLALWNHLTPLRLSSERVQLGTGAVRDVAGHARPTLTLGARF